eukprot:3266951-Amphidinium_carterae.2
MINRELPVELDRIVQLIGWTCAALESANIKSFHDVQGQSDGWFSFEPQIYYHLAVDKDVHKGCLVLTSNNMKWGFCWTD